MAMSLGSGAPRESAAYAERLARSRLMHRILIVAYHFPPLAGSSGIQRTLRFVQHLPALGWEPLVLTAHPRAYERTSEDLMAEIASDTVVCRAQAWDTARHFSIKGRYLGAMARPDRWKSWRFDAVRQGMRLVREYDPSVIFSTYPVATAHLIGAELQRRTGLPWVADFRDPMAQDGYPSDPATWQSYRSIEEMAMQQAAANLFTTPGAAAGYRRQYPHAAERIHVLENGYDESSFASADSVAAAASGPLNPGAVTLLHSGIVYPSERDPTQLMEALRQLHDAGAIQAGKLKIRFRAPVSDGFLHDRAAACGVSDYIEVCPPMGYRDALTEMLRADALLLMQASNCNAQIPAKLYEYLRAGRPVLCLADPAGDTARTVLAAGIDTVVPLDAAAAIADLIGGFLTRPTAYNSKPRPEAVTAANRNARSAQLAALLTSIVGR